MGVYFCDASGIAKRYLLEIGTAWVKALADPGAYDAVQLAKNYLATVPGQRFWVALRLYGPGKAFFDQRWKPDDVVKVK